jgi:3-methyl-2-oxobutanoate hydroxymethyltransferase
LDQQKNVKVRITDLARMKQAGSPITMLTAYDAPFARIFDEAGVDAILVGDSVAMVVQGADSTLPVTLEEILYHTRIVARARKRALLIADMPFLSYQVSAEDAVRKAGRLIKEGGAEAVKLAGIDIPVMGHIGLTPQSIHRMGGHRVQGQREGDAPGCRQRLIDDAKALEQAGAFAIVLEGMPAPLAREITATVAVPTIGIGAGADCDGQVLVMHDMLGLSTGCAPRFVKAYANLWHEASAATHAYLREVRERAFPGPEHSYGLKGKRS